MSDKIKALILEDVQDDAELVVLEIERQGYQIEWKRTDNAEEMLKYLQSEHFDIVISDYVMPQFSGLDALEIAREFDEDIPFIIISGTVGDELAVEAMIAGAHDYIMKDNMVRLGATITRELNEARIRRRLRERENQLNSIFDASPIGIGTVIDRKFTFVNGRMVSMFGYSEEELLGKDVRLLYGSDKEYKRIGTEYYDQLDKDGKAADETIFKTKDGKKIIVSLNSSYIDNNDPGKGITFTIEDISQKKKSEKTRSIIYNISVAINVSNDLKELALRIREELAEIIDINNYYIALYDKEKDMFEFPLHIDENDVLEEVPADKTLSKYAIESGKPVLLYNEDIEKLEKEGVIKRVATPSECWLGIPLKVKGETVGLLGLQSYTDKNAYGSEDIELLNLISEQIATAISLKKAQDDLAHNEERYRFLANASSEGIFIFKNGVCTDTNTRATEMFGYDYDEMLGLSGADLVHEGSRELVRQNMLSGYEEPYEAVGLSKQGVEFPIQIQGRNFEYMGEGIRLTTIFDLTRQKENEKELIRAKDKAEESDKLKSAFLANMSHEIRTPMNAILGFSSLLNDDSLPAEDREDFIEIISTNANTLLRLIEDIIDISKIEAGTLVIRNKKCDLNRIMRDAVQTIQQKIDQNQKDIEIKLEIDLNRIVNVFLDSERFMQVINNLLSNAEKFTSTGSIETGFHIMEMEGNLLFYVKDTGIGIPEEMHESIFERFRQVDDSNTRMFGGAGLGLTITKKLVELMGGKIWLKSKPAEGSIFYFKLPYIPAERRLEKQKEVIGNQETEWTDKKVLIVEDVESNFVYLKALISKTGAKIIWVDNGKAAVDEVKKHEDMSAVLMDLQLPVMDGYTATREIRAFNKNIPIIALTAYAREEDRIKSINSGCTDYLSKPVGKIELLNKLGQYINDK